MKNAEAVLVVGAGMLQCALIREAQALGLYVIATDANPQAPGFILADEHYELSTADVSGHAQLAATLKDSHPCQLRGVVTAGCDCAPSVSAAAEAAGLPGLPLDIAQATHDKAKVRQRLQESGLAQYQPAWSARSETCTQTLEADVALTCGYPCVVKPVAQRASRGLTIVQEPASLAAAVRKAFAYGPAYLIEAQLRGTEHSAEILLEGSETVYQHGRTWWNIVDRMFRYDNGLALELGHVNPTCLTAETQQEILCLVLGAAQALGVHWGPFKIDVMCTEDGPKILEVTARLSGGFDCQGTSPLTGRTPLHMLVQLACGLPVDVPGPVRGYAACAAILPGKTGRVRALPTLGTAVAPMPAALIDEVLWAIQPGDTIAPASHNGARAGFVLARAPLYEAAWQRATSAAEALTAGVEVEA